MNSISIITINLNNKSGLEKTIISVINQTFQDIQFIIVDGGSSDGSIDIIKKYEKKGFKWISEKDNGIYNAMNKGIKEAIGEYCLFLNSGDCLFSDSTIEKIFSDHYEEDILYGNIVFLYEKNRDYVKLPDNITFQHMMSQSIFHPSTFIKRILFDKYGLYNENMKFVSDWDFFMKTIIINSVKTRHLDIPVTNYDTSGISMKSDNFNMIMKEKNESLKKNIPEKILNFYNDYVDLKKKHNETCIKELSKNPFYNTCNLLKKMKQKLFKIGKK